MSKWKVGEEYKTRDSGLARIFNTDGKGIYPVLGAIKYGLGINACWIVAQWTEAGSYVKGHPSYEQDLVPPLPPKVKWLKSIPEIMGEHPGPNFDEDGVLWGVGKYDITVTMLSLFGKPLPTNGKHSEWNFDPSWIIEKEEPSD